MRIALDESDETSFPTGWREARIPLEAGILLIDIETPHKDEEDEYQELKDLFELWETMRVHTEDKLAAEGKR